MIEFLKLFHCIPKGFQTLYWMGAAILLGLLSACTTGDTETSETLMQVYSPTKSYIIKGENRVLAGGCFDVLHVGHFEFLKKAKEQGDYLIIALEPDEKISINKQRALIHAQKLRASNLASIRYVDEVILLPPLKNYEDYQLLVQKIRPRIIAVTQDDPQILNKMKQAQEIGAEVKIVNIRIPGFSSSMIRSKLYDYKRGAKQ